MNDSIRNKAGEEIGPEKHLRAATRRGVSLVALRVAALAVGLLSQVALTRSLTPDAFGAYAWIISWVQIMVVAAVAGADTTALRYISSYRNDPARSPMSDLVRYTRNRALKSTLAIALLGLVIILISRPDQITPLSAILATALIASLSLTSLFAASLRAFGRVRISYTVLQIIRPAGISLGLAILILLGLPIREANGALTLNVWLTVATAFVGFGALYQPLRDMLRTTGITASAEARSSWKNTANGLARLAIGRQLLNWGDVVLVGYLLSLEQAGGFAVAKRIASTIGIGLGAINHDSAHRIARSWHKGDFDSVRTIISNARRLSLGFGAPIMAMIVLTGPLLLGLFGPSYRDLTAPLSILAIGQLINAAAGPVGQFQSMTGNENFALRIILVVGGASAAASFWVIPAYGIVGAATLSAMTITSWNLAYTYATREALKRAAQHGSPGDA